MTRIREEEEVRNRKCCGFITHR